MEQSQPTIGSALREHRLRAGLTQRELARHAGVSLRALREIEHGRVRRPQAQSIDRLAAALSLSADDRDGLLAAAAGPPPRASADPSHLDIGVLGPLVVHRGGVAVEVVPPRLRWLLGLLAVQPGQVVWRDEIVDLLWGSSPPAQAVQSVQRYVWQLRRLLEPERRRRANSQTLVRAHHGYLLEVDEAELDVLRFDKLTDAARRAQAAGERHAAMALFGQALDRWRGPALADLEPLRMHPAAVAISSRRVAATLAYADLAIDLGRCERSVEALRTIAADEPLHEGLHARLMLALAICGQQAAALALFETLRKRLAEELGVEPGPEIQEAHRRVLRHDMPSASAPDGGAPATPQRVVPAQLPADGGAFAGRARHLGQLDALLPEPGAEPTAAMPVVAIVGMAGVGKTALAVHWAQRVRDRFPDGQLYVDLRGHALAPPQTPVEALTHLLYGLGVPAKEVPTDEESAAALYRSLLADRRLLVILDNAAGAAQVRPLLPASPGSLVLVTSRDRLTGLVAHGGARRVALDVLTPEEAGALVAGLLEPDRLRAEPEAAADLARACAYLPLALRIAAANLTDQPHQSVAGYVAELARSNSLAALEADGDSETAVRAAFDLSFNRLSADAQRVFRAFGLAPGPDLTAESAAALVRTRPERARQLLDRLAAAHLVTQHAAGRYGCHDLVRLYAAEQAGRDPESERADAVTRLFDYYLHGAYAATERLYPETLRLPLPAAAEGVPAVGFADNTRALAWLEAERGNLVAAVRHAAAHGPRAAAWRIADALRAYFWLRMYATDWLTVGQAGLVAAKADGDWRAQAAAHRNVADFHNRQSRHHRAIEHYACALELARQAGWLVGQANILGNLGGAYWHFGQLTEAAAHLSESLALSRQTGWLAGQAVSLGNLGLVHRELGNLEAAADHFRQSLALDRRLGSRVGQAIGLANLGEAYRNLGRLEAARECFTQALAMHREVGNRGGEANTLRGLAGVDSDAGRLDEALELATTALTIARDTAERWFEALTLNTLAEIHRQLQRDGEADECLHEALRLSRETRHPYCEAEALIGLGAVRRHLGRPGEARVLTTDALAVARRLGYRILEGQALTGLAAIDVDEDRPARAVEHARQALAVQRVTGYRLGLARSLVVLANALQRVVGAEAARRHLEHALTIFADIGAPPPLVVDRGDGA